MFKVIAMGGFFLSKSFISVCFRNCYPVLVMALWRMDRGIMVVVYLSGHSILFFPSSVYNIKADHFIQI